MMTGKKQEHIRINCEITRDLLPLYHDGVVSESTAHAVEEHLEHCGECTREYEILLQEMPLEVQEAPATGNRFAAMMKRVKKKRILVTGGAAVLSCGLLAGGYYLLTQVPLISVDDENIKVDRVYQYDTEESSRLFLMISTPSFKGPWWADLEEAGEESGSEGTYRLEFKKKVPVISKELEDVPYAEMQWVQDIGDWEDCREVKLGDKVIWTKEENGNEPVPDYVYAYEEFGNGSSVKYMSWSARDEIVSAAYTDGRTITWNLDGEVIEEKNRKDMEE